jgi:hypothetical protein
VKKLSALTRILSSVVMMTIMLTIVPVNGASADGYRHYKRYHRVASFAPAVRHDHCWTGWWQTLYYGHVRPQWGVRCMR